MGRPRKPTALKLVEGNPSKRAEGLMGRFGMDPVSRSRVMVNPQGDLFGNGGAEPPKTARFFNKT